MLIVQAEEAEEVLKQPDPVGSSEPALVQKRMEKLRVRKLYYLATGLLFFFNPCLKEMYLFNMLYLARFIC